MPRGARVRWTERGPSAAGNTRRPFRCARTEEGIVSSDRWIVAATPRTGIRRRRGSVARTRASSTNPGMLLPTPGKVRASTGGLHACSDEANALGGKVPRQPTFVLRRAVICAGEAEWFQIEQLTIRVNRNRQRVLPRSVAGERDPSASRERNTRPRRCWPGPTPGSTSTMRCWSRRTTPPTRRISRSGWSSGPRSIGATAVFSTPC